MKRHPFAPQIIELYRPTLWQRIKRVLRNWRKN